MVLNGFHNIYARLEVSHNYTEPSEAGPIQSCYDKHPGDDQRVTDARRSPDDSSLVGTKIVYTGELAFCKCRQISDSSQHRRS
jgi:hypothetical protein